MVLFGIGGCDRAKVVVFLQSGCIQAKWLYSVKMVVFGQNWFIRAKLLYSGKVVVIGQKWIYSFKVVVLVQIGCI